MTEGAACEVDLAPATQRELRRLPPSDAAGARGPILALALEPRPYRAGRVRGSPFWRVRVGPLRIVYLIDDEAERVTVVHVARRSESTYRKLREGLR